jgi:tripartite-type tricarboxylate transporter receptor subunit TctC
MIAFGKPYRLVASICLLLAASAVVGAHAQDRYPTRPITIVVPFAAGGPTDILARLVSQAISPMLGQQVVVEDVTGAGGTIGATRAARADPDGYTMVMGNLGTHAASLGMYPKLPYDPRTDFKPVILVATTPMVLVTRKTLPLHSLNDVIAYAKANKGKTTMGSAGVGSISHLTLLLFNHLPGAGVVHVPYRGLSQAINDLLGGQIDLLFDQVVTATPHIVNDSKNAIVVTIPQRAAAIPHVPSADEAGSTAHARLVGTVHAQRNAGADRRAHQRCGCTSHERSRDRETLLGDRSRSAAARPALARGVAAIGQCRSR